MYGVAMELSPTISSPFATILLIDDNDKDRTYYAERIRIGIPGCIVLEAKDGRSGLDLYRSRKIDCIITDVDLPDMPGFGLLVELVPLASKPTIAVIMLTQTVPRALHDLAIRNGAQAFFVKRFTSGDELVQAIQKAMAVVGPMRKDRQPPDFNTATALQIESPSDPPIRSSSSLETNDLRGWRRFPVELSSSVSSTGPEWDGTAFNLSRQGCAIHSTRPVQKGDRLHVLIFPGANQTPIEVEVAQVRWTASKQLGVEFLTLTPGEAIRLEDLLAIIGKG